jgi:hypothetical protein
MSAIKLYTSKTDAFYFKDSQRNSFYEFGAIQLIPNNTYTQRADVLAIGANDYTISIYRASNDLEITEADIVSELTIYADSTSIYADSQFIAIDNQVFKIDDNIQKIDTKPIFVDTNTYSFIPYFGSLNGFYYWAITPLVDFYNELVYLKFTNGVNTYYTNPFYITALDEDRCTKITYKQSLSSIEESVGLKVWFRQKSRQSELTTYYESSTKNTVTQNIKTHNLEMYESEFMSVDDLIMTAEILESPYLYIDNKRCSLFEAVKIPELTQQENFGKIKFTLAPNN